MAVPSWLALSGRVLSNHNIFNGVYKQGDLLKDMDELVNVKGLPDLAKMLPTNNRQALGFRYELEAAATFKREGTTVLELSRRVANPVTGRLATDIDIVIRLPDARRAYVQAKRSRLALGYGARGVTNARSWVEKALTDLGSSSYDRIKYVVPPGTKIPPRIQRFFVDNGIEIIRMIHR